MKTETEHKECVVIIMGSKSDKPHADKIIAVLANLAIAYHERIGSAHKTPEHVLKMIESFDLHLTSRVVYITVAGRSDALTAFVDAHTLAPVIACPPSSDRFGGMDILSSLRVPSGIGSMATLEPETAAIAAAKILALANPEIKNRLGLYKVASKTKILDADREIQ